MPLAAAELLARLLLIYAAIGLLIGALFVALGLARVDPAAKGAGLGLRLLLLPLSAALWPWTLVRWMRGGPPPREVTAHKRALAPGASGEAHR